MSNRFVTNLRDELSVNGSQRETRTVQRGKTTYPIHTGRIGTSQPTQPARVITIPTHRTKETPAARARAQPAAVPSAFAVVPQREATVPVVSLPVVSPPRVALPAEEREKLASIPPALTLVRAWEQASEAERQEFVAQHRVILLELLAVQKPQEDPVQTLPPDVPPDTQPGLILIVLRTATAPLSHEELAQVPGINRRVLGRDLTRLWKAGRIEKTADGRYVLQAVSQ